MNVFNTKQKLVKRIIITCLVFFTVMSSVGQTINGEPVNSYGSCIQQEETTWGGECFGETKDNPSGQLAAVTFFTNTCDQPVDVHWRFDGERVNSKGEPLEPGKIKKEYNIKPGQRKKVWECEAKKYSGKIVIVKVVGKEGGTDNGYDTPTSSTPGYTNSSSGTSSTSFSTNTSATSAPSYTYTQNNNPYVNYQQNRVSDFDRAQQIMQERMIAERQKTERIERAVYAGSTRLSGTISKIQGMKADLSVIKGTNSPELALSSYKSELNRIKEMQAQARRRLNENLLAITAQMQTSQSKEESTVMLIEAGVQLTAAAIAQKKANDEKKRLEEEYKRKINGFYLELRKKNLNGFNNAVSYAAAEASKQQEDYYIDLANYYNCNIRYMESNFSYDNTYWAEESNCSYPKNPNINKSAVSLTSDELIDVAKRKEKLFVSNQNSKFREAAVYYLNQGIQKNPKNPEAYFFRSTMHTEMVDQLIDLNYAIKLDPKNSKFTAERNKIQSKVNDELFSAIRFGNSSFVQKSVDNDLHVNARDDKGNTPVMVAIIYDNVEILNILLGNEKSKKDLIAKNGLNYLTWAAMHDAKNTIVFLENQKVNTTYTNPKTKETTLYVASVYNSQNVIDHILKKDKNYKNTLSALLKKKQSEGVTNLCRVRMKQLITEGSTDPSQLKELESLLGTVPALYYEYFDHSNLMIEEVIQKDKYEILELFIKKGADPNVSQQNGKFLIVQSIEHKSDSCLQVLLLNKAEVNVPSSSSGTLLHLALSKGNYFALDKLLKQNINLDIQDREGNTILNKLLQTPYIRKEFIVEVLNKDPQPNVNISDNSGGTPLHWAVKETSLGMTNTGSKNSEKGELVYMLINKGADVNSRDLKGYTPLHYASESGSLEITQLLIRSGAELGIKDVRKRTPYALAVKNKHKEVANLLRSSQRNENAFNVNYEVKEVSCPSENDGQITLSISGGLEPYSFYWEKFPENGSAGLSNIGSGDYLVVIKDARNNQIEETIILEDPSPLTIKVEKQDESFYGMNDGKIVANVSGGQAPYSYSWSNNASKKSLTGLEPGNYTLEVRDNKGCLVSKNVEITGSSKPKPVKEPIVARFFQSANVQNADSEKMERYSDSLVDIKLSNVTIYLERLDFENAQKELEDAIKISKKPEKVYLGYANFYCVNKDWKNTERYAAKALKINEQSPWALFYRARSFEERGLNKKALADYRAAIALDGSNSIFHISAANFFQKQKDFNSALNHYDFLLDSVPEKDPSLFRNRGDVHYSLENYSDALNDYTEYISYHENDPIGYYSRGMTFIQNLQYERAEDDFNTSIQLNLDSSLQLSLKNDGIRYYQLGKKALIKRDSASALHYYLSSEKLNPDFQRSYLESGKILLVIDQSDIAIEKFTKATSIQVDYDSAFYYRAIGYRDLGQFDLSDADLARAIDINNTYYEALIERASLNMDLSNYELSKNLYQSAINIKPKVDFLYTESAKANLNLGFYDLTIENASKGIKYNKKNFENYFLKGKGYYALGKWKKSLKNFEKSIDYNKKFSEGFYEKGRTLFQLKDYKKALKSFKKASALKDEPYLASILMQARTEFELKMYQESADNFIQLFQVDSTYGTAENYLALGRAFLDMKKKGAEESERYFKISLDKKDTMETKYFLACALAKKEDLGGAMKILRVILNEDPSMAQKIKKSTYFKVLSKDKETKREFKTITKK